MTKPAVVDNCNLGGVIYDVAIDWANGEAEATKLKRAILNAIRPYLQDTKPVAEPAVVDEALTKAAEILANFKGCEAHEDGTPERKLEEWQACYAKLFTQMNELVQEMHKLKSTPAPVPGWQPIETAPKDAQWLTVRGRDWLLGDDESYAVIPDDQPPYECKAFRVPDPKKEGFNWCFMGKVLRPTLFLSSTTKESGT